MIKQYVVALNDLTYMFVNKEKNDWVAPTLGTAGMAALGTGVGLLAHKPIAKMIMKAKLPGIIEKHVTGPKGFYGPTVTNEATKTINSVIPAGKIEGAIPKDVRPFLTTTNKEALLKAKSNFKSPLEKTPEEARVVMANAARKEANTAKKASSKEIGESLRKIRGATAVGAGIAGGVTGGFAGYGLTNNNRKSRR